MQIGYLGPLEVRFGDRTVDVPGRRLRTLLGRLATDVGRPVPPRALIEALWADEAPTDPANALQSLVSRLRRTLGDPAMVEQVAGGYRLAVDAEDVDAVRFARLAATGRSQLGAGSPVHAAETLRQALALWRGEPLPDDDSLEADAVRARLHDLHLQALVDRIDADLTGRAHDELDGAPGLSGIVAELEQLVAEHPLREDLAALRIRALVTAGRPAQALAAYETTRAYLADTLGTDPSPALQEQHLELLRLQDSGPPGRRTNLRAALTSFVGRDDAARQVDGLLGGANRLVTIVGTGGAGKTRLASEVAAGWVSRLSDGVWFAELAPVSDADNIAVAVLDGLGLRDVAARSANERVSLAARERILQTLADTDCLVVIDNCEHVIDAAAALVADILGQCPGVRVIATSREPLGIDGETLYALTPLALPAKDAPPAGAAGSPAVRLLLDRACSVGADLVLDDATVGDVVEVVRRLDGLPLAIELAAARLRVLSIAEIATRLGDRFRLLTGGRRTALPRHRTLKAVVEWSWELLTQLERDVAEHFAVFGSGATSAAVAAVCDCGTPSEIEDALHALVDKSLLVAGRDEGVARFRMLETLREFGTERLDERGELQAARTAHGLYYADLVRDADQGLRTPDQLTWLRRLDVERDNILAALTFLGEQGRADRAVEMAVGLAWFWLMRENGKDSVRWLRFALDLPGAADAPLVVVAEALHTMNEAARPGEPFDVDRRETLLSLVERLEPVENLHQLVPLLRLLLLFFAQERSRGIELAAQNMAAADPWTSAATRTIRVAFRENDGDIDGMREDLAAAITEWEQLGDYWGRATILTARGQLRTLDGDSAGAAADFEEALHLLRQLGGGTEDLLVNMRLADLRLRAGDFDGAKRFATAIRNDREPAEFGYGHGVLSDIMLGGIAFEEGDDETLTRVRDRLLVTLDTITQPSSWHSHALAMGHGFLSTIACQAGDLVTARQHLVQGLMHAEQTKDRPILAAVGVGAARYVAELGRQRDAAVLLGATAGLRGSEDPTALAIARLTAELGQALGSEFDAAYAEGRGLSREEALARLDPEQLP